MPPPFFCQELFRDPDKTQVIGVLEARMTRFLITWKVVCTCPCVCACTCICTKDVYSSASNVSLRACGENCLKWRAGFELDGFYFSHINLWK